MEPEDIMQMTVSEVSAILAKQLAENKKTFDIHKSYIVLDGVNRFNDCAVALTIELKEKEEII